MPDNLPPSGDHAGSYWRTPVALSEAIADLSTSPDTSEFARFAEYLPTLCWLARADGYIVWYNRRWHDYCGTTPEQMEGWGWQSVHDPEQLPRVMSNWQGCIGDGEPFEMVFPLRGADGLFRPFLTRVVPIRDRSGSVVRWFGVNTEIGAQLRAETALRESEAKLAVLTDAMPQMVWSTRPDGYHDYYNAQWYAFTGMPPGSTDGDGWNGIFHPDDQPLAWERWRHSLATGDPYEIEYRLRHHSGAYRWTLGRAVPVRDESGTITRWIGTCTDIHEAKQAAEQNELLSMELSHRIKNIFSVVAGLLNLTGRRSGELRGVMTELMGRVAALARAHDFARPHSPESRPSMPQLGTLHGLLSELLRPYREGKSDRFEIAGEDAPIDDHGAAPLALVVHELATNAAKYGALSSAEGLVRIRIERAGEDLTLIWSEQGGPPVRGSPDHQGFGTELAQLSVERQLGGTITREWLERGLEVRIRVKASCLQRK